MKDIGSYKWVAQALMLILYIITLSIYNRAKKDYSGGKVGSAINLILIFVAFLLILEYIEFFNGLLFFLDEDFLFTVKTILKLTGIVILSLGGIRFISDQPHLLNFFAKNKSSSADAAISNIAAIAADLIPQQTSETSSLNSDIRGIESHIDDGLDPDLTLLDMDTNFQFPSLGRYEILCELGRGAMGIVYKGRDPKLDRLTAIKTIHFSELNEKRAYTLKNKFNKEAKILAKFSHPNIVTIYDVGEDLDVSYLSMEYLDSETLEKYTQKNALLPMTKCVHITKQVLSALEHAHHHGIVHRDIKPANILLLNNDQIKVTDFGIARICTTSTTKTGTVQGTPHYMSPEQIAGRKVDHRSDIFSSGVVLYQLLTGALPFNGENLTTIMYQITHAKSKSVHHLNQKIPDALSHIIDKALAKNPDDRFQTAWHMEELLKEIHFT